MRSGESGKRSSSRAARSIACAGPSASSACTAAARSARSLPTRAYSARFVRAAGPASRSARWSASRSRPLARGREFERAGERRERGVARARLRLRAGAPRERFGIPVEFAARERRGRAGCVAGSEELDPGVERALPDVLRLRELGDDARERARRARVVAELREREALAARGGVRVGPRADGAVRLERATRVVRVEERFSEQERELVAALRGLRREHRARRGGRVRRLAEPEQAPRAPRARIERVRTVRRGAQELVEVRERGGGVLARELRLREQRERGRAEVLLPRREHAPERGLGLRARAAVEEALCESELDLRGELEPRALRELRELGTRLGEAPELEQRAREPVAGEFGLRVVRIRAEELARLADDAVVEPLLRQRRDVGVLLVRVLRGDAEERDDEEECPHAASRITTRASRPCAARPASTTAVV